MDYRLECEVRLGDHQRRTAAIDAEGWRRAIARPELRLSVARMLVATAIRLVPTIAPAPGHARVVPQ